LMARAVDSLSRVEQPRRELERRLIKGLEDSETKEDVKAVLDRLEEMKLLSDQRFAEMKVRSAAPRMGDRKLQAELRRSGVDEATVRAAMEQLDEPEELRCWRVWCRKWSELPKDWKTREKMIRYLSYRGFGMGAIQKVLRGEVELPEENADGEF
jgi:recX family